MLFDASSPDKKSYLSFLESAETASDWLASQGARVDSNRVAQLLKHLRSYASLTNAAPTDSSGYWTHLWQMSEIHDLVEIHRNLAGVSDARFFITLKKVTSGPPLLADEGTDGGSIQARNAAFELFTAARLARGGLPVTFETDADITVQVEDSMVAVECKRVSSADGLDGRIREAHKQILGRIDAKEAHAGVIAISLSRLVHQVSQEKPDAVHADPIAIQTECRQMVANWGPAVIRIFGGLAPSTIAIILQYKLPFISTVDGAPTMLSRFVSYPLVNDENRRLAKINAAIRQALIDSVGI